ncbi:MAG: hypothetical protein ACTH31_01840 [Pseudoclavibacter sp.]
MRELTSRPRLETVAVVIADTDADADEPRALMQRLDTLHAPVANQPRIAEGVQCSPQADVLGNTCHRQ